MECSLLRQLSRKCQLDRVQVRKLDLGIYNQMGKICRLTIHIQVRKYQQHIQLGSKLDLSIRNQQGKLCMIYEKSVSF